MFWVEISLLVMSVLTNVKLVPDGFGVPSLLSSGYYRIMNHQSSGMPPFDCLLFGVGLHFINLSLEGRFGL